MTTLKQSRPYRWFALAAAVAMLAVLASSPATASTAASPTAFRYDGTLVKPDGAYDLQFTLWSAAGAGAQIGDTVTIENAALKATRFTVVLDFGPGASPSDARFLELSWRRATSSGPFTTVLPRTPLRPLQSALWLTLPLFETADANAPGLFVRNMGTGPQSFGLRGDSATNFGVAGITNGGFAGVYGNGTGPNNGVYGLVGNSAGSGVYGKNAGSGAGVTGDSALGYGVVGRGAGSSFSGVYGTGPHNGLFGDVNNAVDSGVYGHNAGAGWGVTGFSDHGDGVQGKGARNGVFGETGNNGASGVYGQNDGTGYGVAGRSANGVGVLADSANGWAVKATGNVTQSLGSGGFLKAAVIVSGANDSIVSCYNSQAAPAIAQSNGCGFTMTRQAGTSGYTFDLGFPVTGRFISLTAIDGQATLNDFPGATKIQVITRTSGGANALRSFYLLVF
jgi:hypothetical protein